MVDGRAGRKRPRRVAGDGAEDGAPGTTDSIQQHDEHHAYEVGSVLDIRLHADNQGSKRRSSAKYPWLGEQKHFISGGGCCSSTLD